MIVGILSSIIDFVYEEISDVVEEIGQIICGEK